MTAESPLSSSRGIVYLRGAQLFCVPVTLSLLGYAVGKPGYWTNLPSLFAMAVTAGVATIISTIIFLYIHKKHGNVRLQNKLTAIWPDVFLMFLWIAASAVVFKTKQIDPNRYKDSLPEPPSAIWYTGAGFSILEAVMFAVSIAMMYNQHKALRSSSR